jgi:hypothetical protein
LATGRSASPIAADAVAGVGVLGSDDGGRCSDVGALFDFECLRLPLDLHDCRDPLLLGAARFFGLATLAQLRCGCRVPLRFGTFALLFQG